MGMDYYAKAVWGLKTTRSAVKETRWVGAEGAPRTAFDASTGKPNYKTTETTPSELEKYEITSVGCYNDEEVIITLAKVSSDSHRNGRTSAVRVLPQPAAAEYERFVTDMTKIGLWREADFGHWVFLYVSV